METIFELLPIAIFIAINIFLSKKKGKIAAKKEQPKLEKPPKKIVPRMQVKQKQAYIPDVPKEPTVETVEEDSFATLHADIHHKQNVICSNLQDVSEVAEKESDFTLTPIQEAYVNYEIFSKPKGMRK